MKTLLLGLLLAAGSAAFGQETSDLFDKAPPAIDDALRARVAQFYQYYVDGKFKSAYAMVAADSQDAFFESGKSEYKGCEHLKITYTENFTKATVLEVCQGEFHWHGESVPTKVPVTSNWKIVDGQWYWFYVKPKFVQTPFSPTGKVPLPDNQPVTNAGNFNIPKDPTASAQSILALVKVDKTVVQLHSEFTSRDEVHLKNEMQGPISLSIDPVSLPGLKITAGKLNLEANEETAVVFEYKLDDASIVCGDCAKRVHDSLIAQVHVQPTGQVFPITVKFISQEHHELALPKK